MDTSKSTSGRPRDTFTDPHLLPIEGDSVIAKTCRYCGHQFSIKTSVTRIKAHLGGVSGQGVAPCKHVPLFVKEAAKNAMPSSSNNPRSDANTASNSDMLQPPYGECYTSCSPLQTMQSAQEQCPRLLDGSQQQGDVDSTYLVMHQPEMEIVIPEVLQSQEGVGDFQFILTSLYSEPKPMDTEQLCKNDEAYGGVPSQSVTPNEEVPSNVKEAARNAMPNSSSNLRSISLLLPSAADIPRASDLQQLPLQEENFHSYYEDLRSALEPIDTQQCYMNDEINLPHEIENPPLSSKLEPQMDVVPPFAPSNPELTTFDQTKLKKKRKLLNRAPLSGKKIPVVIKFQGPTFNRKVEEIYASLQDDSTSKIGVYGMGGSGKTTIMKHIHNLLLEEHSMPFSQVIWITMSQDHTIPKLQRHLASKLDVTLPHDEDQVAWAATLYEKMQNMCYVLILDDMWDEVNLEEVGVPEPSQGSRCKLILTTRWLDVCNKMNCNRAIFLDLFSQEEAWELFAKTLNVTPKDLVIQGIMKEVAKECARLPLAIVTVAGSMRGILNIHEWRNALDSLRSRTYGFTDMDKKVLEKLKFSYYRLSEQLQQCLLYCALYPEDYLIKRVDLIEMLIVEGNIGSDKSLSSAYDQGHTIVNKLENACLLMRFSSRNDELVIHDLIRDMCLDIMGDRFLVKCRSEFPPNKSEYSEVVEKVSLMKSEFKEIPSQMAPFCPKLSTLLLWKNPYLTRVSNSFFMGLPGLKVLNLSDTSIQELPDSITNLVSLNALVLQRCFKLRCLPCLTPLKALKKLDLYGSGIIQAPEGLDKLVSLTYLDLDYTNIKTPLSASLGNLVKLQYLKLPYDTKIMMKDVKELKHLEVFEAEFANWEDFNEYVSSNFKSGQGLCRYRIQAEITCVGASCMSMSYEISRDEASCMSMSYEISKDEKEGIIRAKLHLKEYHNTRGDNWLSCEVIEQIPLPEIVQELSIVGLPSHSHQGQTEDNGELRRHLDATFLLAFANLINLQVQFLDSTNDLISASSSVVEPSCLPITRSVPECSKSVKLGDPKLLACFQNLKMIQICFCKSLESMVSTTNPTEKEESKNPISFPNLRELTLWELPNLRSICNSTLICPSVEYISIFSCPKLKRLPLQLPVDNNINSGQLSPPLSSLKEIQGDSRWWESLEWDHAHAKTLLQPYFKPWPM